MVSAINKDVKLLTLSFFLIFFGFGGVQQYVTTYFATIGLANIGFQSLIMIYLFFMLFDPLSAVFVSKYGAKKCMIASSVFYFIYIISLLSKSAYMIYFSSSLLGIAASMLWTGQNSYLIRASDKKSYGTNSGFFSSLKELSTALGVFIIGFVISGLSYNSSFLIFSAFPVIGFLTLFYMRDIMTEQKTDHFTLIKKSITSITALKLSGIWFTTYFSFGLIIGIIPLEIRNVIGETYVGILSSLFYVMPIILSYFFGKLSDTRGRRTMIFLSYLLLITGVISLYFSSQPIFLISGIFLLALNWAIILPSTYALAGDVSTGHNLEYLIALFWMIQNMGIVSALILSQIFKSEIITLYLISFIVIICSFIIVYPLLRQTTERIREKIALEMK